MKVVYFASLRERLGLSDEIVTLPPDVRTVADVVALLAQRDEVFGEVFSNGVFRAALDKKHVKPEALIAGAREIAFFPPMTGG